ncbi:MAG: lipid-binding SYLF domain-containing protein [Candidatus Tectomicrobia bacterium]|nr:lipid-binding SYLF domain-containing protein [Candidatus Tectomicrobia bacterium]
MRHRAIAAGTLFVLTAWWAAAPSWVGLPGNPSALAQSAFGEEPEDADALRLAATLIREITAIPEKGMPPALLRNAHGIAIIPGVIKVGLVLGGRYGKGVLLVRNPAGGWEEPKEITLTGGSLGWQVGVQSTDVILVFKSAKSVEGFASGKITLGADASVAAGPVGRHAEAATDVQLKSEVYSYSRNRGLFVGVSLEGSGLQSGKALRAPNAARQLQEAIERAAPQKP